MCEFDFAFSEPGLLHLASLLIGSACIMLGFLSHSNASWVRKEEYKQCQDPAWKAAADQGKCPDLSLETSFLIISVICFVSSFFWYSCNVCCCFGKSKIGHLVYVLYSTLAAVALVAAGVLYIKSAIMISNLPGPDYGPVIGNMGRVIVAAFNNEDPDQMQMTPQSVEQTYYQEKIATGVLTIVNGVIHLMCAWLVIIEARKT